MISPLYFGYAALGGIIQLAVIWFMRAKGWPFYWVLPAIVAHQFLFTAAYAKAPNFVAQWFLTAALTGLASFVLGVTLFGDKLNLVNVAGIFMVFGGLALLKLG
jgi:multidrug transporter EmrE-like cation transporter